MLALVALCAFACWTAPDARAQTGDADTPPVQTSHTAQSGADAPETVLDYFVAGGKLMWVILACSVVGFAFVIERVVNLRRSNVVNDTDFARIMESLESRGPEAARARATERPSPMSRVLANVLSCAASPQSEMETMLEDAGARELWQLRRNAKPLGIISNITPLLGLLGTVLGIIKAFRDVATEEGAIGNPKLLAEGIYEALLTTAAGLTVAIPAFLFFHFFMGKADALVRDIEEKALVLIAALMRLRTGGKSAASQ